MRWLTKPSDDKSPQLNMWVILISGKSSCGVVNAYDSSRHIGIHTSFESAMNHAKRLAVSHPGTDYVIARIESIVSQSKDQNIALHNSIENITTMGDLYDAVGAKETRASRLWHQPTSNGKDFSG